MTWNNLPEMHELPEPVSVRFDEARMWVELADGRVLGMPLAWYPRLKNATPADREDCFLSPSGVHWDTLDEDLSERGMLLGKWTYGGRKLADAERDEAT